MPIFREVTQAAMEIADEAQRGKYLDGACQGDVELRAKVERFLSAQPSAEKFFTECAAAVTQSKQDSEFLAGLGKNQAAAAAEFLGDPVGSRIGPYKLLQSIGEGGCGVVYRAEQDKPV